VTYGEDWKQTVILVPSIFECPPLLGCDARDPAHPWPAVPVGSAASGSLGLHVMTQTCSFCIPRAARVSSRARSRWCRVALRRAAPPCQWPSRGPRSRLGLRQVMQYRAGIASVVGLCRVASGSVFSGATQSSPWTDVHN
jgi:hypothetical protein